jgi:membrane-associated phospholipid phosphatase
MNWIVPAILTLTGFAALALSQTKHHKTLRGTAPAPGRVRWLQAIGWACLASSTAWCVNRFGAGYGLVVETALLNAAGVTIALTLAYRGHRPVRHQ